MRFIDLGFGDARAQRRHVGALVVRAAQRRSDAVGACMFELVGLGWSAGGVRCPLGLLWGGARRVRRSCCVR